MNQEQLALAYAYFIQGLEYKRVGDIINSSRSLKKAIEAGCDEASDTLREVQQLIISRTQAQALRPRFPPRDSNR